MTAHDLYERIVGEIGFPRKEFLYDIVFWEARRIIRGADARTRQMWSAVRWHTYNMMVAQVGSDSLKKEGISNASDLLPFPWEKETPPPVSKEDADDLLDLINDMNGKPSQ